MSSIFGKIFLRGIYLDIRKFHKKIVGELTKIKHDCEEHLQAINENTNEIAANYEYIAELERKLERIAERVDQVQLYLEANANATFAKPSDFDVRKLNRKEQEVFLVIYTLEEQKDVTYEDIAAKLSISVQLAGNYVTALIEKGVPIIKRYVNLRPYLRLNPVFKTLQAKENILQLSLQEFGF